MEKLPKAPSSLGKHGRKLWGDVLRDWVINSADLLAILELACVACDLMHAARTELERDGLTLPTKDGGRKAHPASAVARSANASMLRALSQLKLTDDPKPKIGRPATRI